MEGDIIEIEPIEDYNVHRAKLRASLLWLLHKAYPDGIPKDLQELYYEKADGNLHILPRLANLLVSSEVYCLACASLFKDTAYQWQGHWSIIQVLSRKGIYVMETDEVAVTATVLVQTAPFRINAHLALIDALMTAYSSEILTIQNVVQAVKRFTTFTASSDLPSSVDDAALFWLNKVSMTLLRRQEEERKMHQQQLIQGESTQKVRITRKQLSAIELPVIEEMKDLVRDVSDGCSLGATISFYCPQHLRFNEICLKQNLGIADSLYNLRLVRNFCRKNLPVQCFQFEYVDLLYSNESLRINLLALITELFYLFELDKAECVTEGVRPSTVSKLVSVPNVPISEATRRSFYKTELEESSTPPSDLTNVPPSPMPHLHPRQVLLPKRMIQDDGAIQESQSTRHPVAPGHSAHHSILAWQEGSEYTEDRRPGRRPAPGKMLETRDSPILSNNSPSQSHPSHLLANVSMDSEILDSYRSVDLEGFGESLEVEATENPPKSPGAFQSSPINNGGAEFLNISSSGSSVQMSTQMGLRSSMHSPRGDPLLPARIRSAKEKAGIHSKAEERGENCAKRTSYPAVKRVKVQADSQLYEQSQSEVLSVKVSSDSSSSLLSEGMVVTPLPQDQLESYTHVPVPVPSHSYTIPDVVTTVEAAISAGIPVVSHSVQNGDSYPTAAEVVRRSRQSSITSNRSSGEFSDHESQKIHLDHKSCESAVPKELSPSRSLEQVDSRPDTLPVAKQIIEPSIQKASVILMDENNKLSGHTTNFAQLKKLRDDGQFENSGFVFMQHGQETNGNAGNKTSLKAAFQRKQAEGNKADKRTTFATLPNQTTWQQNAQRIHSAETSSRQPLENGDTAHPMPSDLLHVRMKLEEKRRLIEREKHRMELQKSKQRQRLGKAAFMHVLSKKEGKENSIQELPESSMTRSAEERIAPLDGASSAMSTSQPNYSEQLAEASVPGNGRPSRTFSREDIQNTIENVKKKWFSDQNGDLSRTGRSTTSSQLETKDPTELRRNSYGTRDLGQRYTPPLDTRMTPPLQQEEVPRTMRADISARISPPQKEAVSRSSRAEILARMTPPPLVQPHADSRSSPRPSLERDPSSQLQRRSSADHRASPTVVSSTDHRASPTSVMSIDHQASPIAISSARKSSKDFANEGENYDQYNSSLDKLNHSLSELQGEIMRLSLKQEQLKNSPTEPIGPVIPAQTVLTSGRKINPSPLPHAGHPPGELWSGQDPSAFRQSPQTVASGQPTTYPSVSQPYTSPPAMHAAAQQPPFVLHGQAGGNYPPGAVYTSPNQYSGGFIPQQPPFSLQSPPMYQQMYHQNPSYGSQSAITPPFMMQMQPTSSQPYIPPVSTGGQYPSVPGYPPNPQHSGTHTVLSHTHSHSASDSMCPAVTVSQSRQQPFQGVPERSRQHPHEMLQENMLSEDPIPARAQTPGMQNAMALIQGKGSVQRNSGYLEQTSQLTSIPPDDHDQTDGANEGFFVSFGAETPKRSKPKLGKDRVKEEEAVTPVRPSCPSKLDETHNLSGSSNSSSPVINNHNQTGSDHNTSGIGFVIGEDDSAIDKTIEDEMQKKREKMLQLTQKRREEQEKKRQEKEQIEAKKREKERKKQEDSEQKKAEDRARRDSIFQKYKERKLKGDQEEVEEPKSRKERHRDRPRPKSMIVKTRTPVHQNGGPVRAGNSHDDLHASLGTEFSAPSPIPSGRFTPKRGKLYRPASCHLMDTVGSADPRTAIPVPISGSLTHRRPPSPDLYARFQNRKAISARGADNNSETGSAGGSDYAGPKLYVKPSQKSNRHIIVNAVSHVCLAGTVNTDLKNKVLEEMSSSDAKHFLILFRSAGCQFRGLYTFDPDTEVSFKLTGAGPKQLTNKAIETFYKYNSGAKKFNIVESTKHISVSIDAVVAHNSVWKPAKSTAAKR